MNNRIAMLNKELHTRLFDEQQFPQQEEEHPRIHRRNMLPPQFILKTMIKKGLTNTQSIASRPKTATSAFKRTTEERVPLDRLRSSGTPMRSMRTPRLRYDQQLPGGESDCQGLPRQFSQFGQILDQMKIQREQQVSRKKIKLERYSEKKFRFAWRKCNIPS